jgi:molybdate/tungstate transport system substrate-binding protein
MRWAGGAALVLLALTVAGCGSGDGHGTVKVLYAGSLANIMERDIGPAFSRAEGYGYQGFAAGSTELAAQIKSRVRRGDVFISSSPDADRLLEGPANGNHVHWYATFATAPLVIGYNPNSRFAAQFRSEPWYRVVIQRGIRVGRTDPRLDPKGKLTVRALERAAAALHEPALKAALERFPVFPEEDLVGRLEAGQLDAGFFYSVEAAAQHIPTISLAPVSAAATYTVTILNGAPDPRGARAFIAFFLGARGRAILAAQGAKLRDPAVSGPLAAVPRSLRMALGAR